MASASRVISGFVLLLVFLTFIMLSPDAPRSALRRKIDRSVSRYLRLKTMIAALWGTHMMRRLGLSRAHPQAASWPFGPRACLRLKSPL